MSHIQNFTNYCALAYGLKPHALSSVRVSQMTSYELECAKAIVEPNRCYQNCFNLAMELGYRYVVGICDFLIPFQHAWLLTDDDRFIDPTLQIVIGNQQVKEHSYHCLLDIHRSTMTDIACETGYPPMIEHLEKMDQFANCFLSHDERRLFSFGVAA